MSHVKPPRAADDQIVMTLAALAGGWALLAALLPWSGGRVLATLGAGYRPISSTAAATLLALAAALVLGRRHCPWARLGARALAATVALTCLGILVGHGLGRAPLAAPEPSGFQGVLRFRMSPLAAAQVLGLSLAAGLGAAGRGTSRRGRQWGAALALAPLGVGLVALVTYAAGAPLLHGTRTIPMTLPTTLLSTLLAVLVLVAAGRDTWPRFLFVRAGPEADLLTSRRGPALVFLALQEELGGGSAEFALWAPVLGGPDGSGAGALLFQVEAPSFLARILAPWPRALPSAEVLMVGREARPGSASRSSGGPARPASRACSGAGTAPPSRPRSAPGSSPWPTRPMCCTWPGTSPSVTGPRRNAGRWRPG